MDNNLIGTSTVTTNGLGELTLTSTGTTSNTHNLYSAPELIKAIIKDDSIELIYKRQYNVSYGYGMPYPEVYKDIYSRIGGDVRREIGTYVPAQSESYVFDSDLI